MSYKPGEMREVDTWGVVGGFGNGNFATGIAEKRGDTLLQGEPLLCGFQGHLEAQSCGLRWRGWLYQEGAYPAHFGTCAGIPGKARPGGIRQLPPEGRHADYPVCPFRPPAKNGRRPRSRGGFQPERGACGRGDAPILHLPQHLRVRLADCGHAVLPGLQDQEGRDLRKAPPLLRRPFSSPGGGLGIRG